MYDFLDRLVADLTAGDRRLLAATRAWVHQLTIAGAAGPVAAEALGAGSDAFDVAMRALDEGSSETLVFERPCHSTVSEVEAMWLSIWALVRSDRIGAARAALGGLVDRQAVAGVLGPMMRVAARG